MAREKAFVEGEQTIRLHPTKVDCFHQVIRDDEGAAVLHLTTFGSADRASTPKSSQSIQLDRKTARELVGIIEDAFPGLVVSGMTWSG
ncbi:hypothetical protein [Agromyces sp. NPDC058064]|uniref:hypothetical protein n=1 Tax=Agromyces sp. NPDC058064 TaxID=3346322 RepID=UPI0036DF7FF3